MNKILILLISPILLLSQNVSNDKVFLDTVDVSVLLTENEERMFNGNSIISINSGYRIWFDIGNYDTLPCKAIYEGKLFTGIGEDFKNDTLVGRYTFFEGEIILAYTNRTDQAIASIYSFNNMFKNGEELLFWDGKLSRKIHYKNGVLHGRFLTFEDAFDYGYGYLRVHGQFRNGKKDGDWIYYSTEAEIRGDNNLEQKIGEIQFTEKWKNGIQIE